jgi:hypothetical protein
MGKRVSNPMGASTPDGIVVARRFAATRMPRHWPPHAPASEDQAALGAAAAVSRAFSHWRGVSSWTRLRGWVEIRSITSCR